MTTWQCFRLFRTAFMSNLKHCQYFGSEQQNLKNSAFLYMAAFRTLHVFYLFLAFQNSFLLVRRVLLWCSWKYSFLMENVATGRISMFCVAVIVAKIASVSLKSNKKLPLFERKTIESTSVTEYFYLLWATFMSILEHYLLVFSRSIPKIQSLLVFLLF